MKTERIPETRITTDSPVHRDAPLELQCPECAEPVLVARDELADGAPIECRHCGLEAELAREFDTRANNGRWSLVDPLAIDDEEEGRRT